ncbi:MAG: hypothetical protein FD189_2151 [Elusimicrobia bacterium]|nr:MAG: hypothetical protein FD154_2165 [Elusimicrobiota bacterium]KAF0153980.1 MAG: hypothetical protein FD189_2151 [Elusimicrobiota bacterium]
MIFESWKGAFGLMARSRGEAVSYVAATVFGAWLYILACGALGVAGPYSMNQAMKAEPGLTFIAYLPGMLIGAWFGAGLAGRMIMHALGGSAEKMAFYAGKWFGRKLGWDVSFALILFLPVLLLVMMPAGLLLAIPWMLAALWLGVRFALWLNISVEGDLPLIESLKRSFAVSEGRFFQLLFITALPMGALRLLHWLVSKAAPGEAVLFYLKFLLEGMAYALIIGAVACFYAKITRPREEPVF